MNTKILAALLLLAPGISVSGDIASHKKDNPLLAVKSVLANFSSSTMTPDGAVDWKGSEISIIGAVETTQPKKGAKKAAIRVIQVFGRHPPGRLGRFYLVKNGSHWEVADWLDISLHEAESGVLALIGNNTYQKAFGHFDTDLPINQ